MHISDSALLTDLYELNMVHAYEAGAKTGPAVFEFFVRRLPECRNFLVAAGLEQALDFLESVRFTADDLDWLKASGRFAPQFVDRLADFRFTGDVHAVAEGTIFFPDEPILRVTAPLPQAQLVESRLINILHFQTLIASKAARLVLAAPDKLLVDFGLRRAHGAEAGLMAAREPVTSPAFTALRRPWRGGCGTYPSMAPWPIPSSRRMTARLKPSRLSRALARMAWCC